MYKKAQAIFKLGHLKNEREIKKKTERDTLVCGNESEKRKCDKVIASRMTEVMGAQSRRESTCLVVSKQSTLADQRVKKKAHSVAQQKIYSKAKQGDAASLDQKDNTLHLLLGDKQRDMDQGLVRWQ